jgi:hypothetical protein
MQGIYTYIPETNHVPKEYNIAAILSLLFMVPISLAPVWALMYFYIRTFPSVCAVPNVAVFCSYYYYYYYYLHWMELEINYYFPSLVKSLCSICVLSIRLFTEQVDFT